MNTVFIIVGLIGTILIVYFSNKFFKNEERRKIRQAINELKEMEGNLLEHILNIVSESQVIEKFAQELTLDELIEGLREYSFKETEYLRILLEPHIRRCRTVEDMKALEQALSNIKFQIRACHITKKTEKQWLKYSPSYSVACDRYRSLRHPKWGRPIIEQFGKEALSKAKSLTDIMKIRNSFEIRYQTWDKKTRYCPIYYLASEWLLAEIKTQIGNAETLRRLAVILSQIVEYDVGEDAYDVAMAKANKIANGLALRAVIRILQRQGLSLSQTVEAERIIEGRLLSENKEEKIEEVIPSLNGRLQKIALTLKKAHLF